MTDNATTHMLSEHPLGRVCSSQVCFSLSIFYSHLAHSAHAVPDVVMVLGVTSETEVKRTEAGNS